MWGDQIIKKPWRGISKLRFLSSKKEIYLSWAYWRARGEVYLSSAKWSVRGKACQLSELTVVNCTLNHCLEDSKVKCISDQLITESGRKHQEHMYHWPVHRYWGEIDEKVYAWLAQWQSVSLISSLKWRRSTSLIISLEKVRGEECTCSASLKSQGEVDERQIHWRVEDKSQGWSACLISSR